MQFLEFSLELDHFPLHDAPVDFQLLFTRPACADACWCAACDAFEVGPHRSQARIGVFKLRQFHLQFRFGGFGAGGENIEDQFTAINHLAIGDFFNVGNVRGRKIVVENEHIGFVCANAFSQFINLA